jgi:Zn-dependent metalloprotease
MQEVESRTVTAPDAWDRYYQVHADLEPILGTPGVPTASQGESLSAAGGSFVQAAQDGFFLLAEEPLDRDAVEVCAELAGVPKAGAFASTSGTRRREARHTGTGTHVQVESLVRGARLIGSDVRVHRDAEGIFAITGRPIGELESRDPGSPPVANEAEALDTCAQRFELEDGLKAARVEQVVFPEGDGATWAYEVSFVVPQHAADVRVFLRADDFSVLLSYNISSAAAGKARVYPVNPLQTENLIDVAFDDLDDPGNFLRGPAFDIRQGDGVRLDRAGGDFTADPAEPGLDEGQAYYQLHKIRSYFGTIVDAGLLQQRPFTPMTATVNDPASPNNAYYQPSTGQLSFGLFGDRSAARSAAVVYHEFGHAITDAICELGRSKTSNTNARGMSEGFSDYFAAAALDDPRLGDYVSGNPEGARNCSDPTLRFAPDHEGEEHDTGAVWAAFLWSVRQRIEPTAADGIVIGSVDFLAPTSTFDEAVSALHSADKQLFAGANEVVIDEEYRRRSS